VPLTRPPTITPCHPNGPRPAGPTAAAQLAHPQAGLGRAAASGRAVGPGRGRKAAGRVRLQCCVVSLVRVQSIGGHSVTTYEAEGNCVAVMRGGEQPEANEQPVG
jgi:hypothetical protein